MNRINCIVAIRLVVETRPDLRNQRLCPRGRSTTMCDFVVGLTSDTDKYAARGESYGLLKLHPLQNTSSEWLHSPNYVSRSGKLNAKMPRYNSVSDLRPYSGGGVGGLTLAVALSAYHDIQVDVYERAAQFAEVGAGVGLWWRPRRVLANMGIESDLTQIVGQFQDERGQYSPWLPEAITHDQ